MFRGRSKHILDEKGRLAVPSRFKEVLKEKGNDTLVITNKGECLWAIPKDAWSILEEKVANLPLFDEAGIKFLRGFISSAEECSLKSGRITIPARLREEAGLEKEVVLAGHLKKSEIWDKDKWDEEYEKVRDISPESSPSLQELRI
jgi:MraZ protein